MKLYRVVAYVLNLNGDVPTKEELTLTMESNRYPEFLNVREVKETDCGEWNDDHELNLRGAPYEKYFPTVPSSGEVDNVSLLADYDRLNKLLVEYGPLIEKLERENYELKREVAQLKRVKEFLKTIRDLTT